jgi:hypothetical protein
MTKRKLQLVADKRKTLISELSPEEEARFLNLADVALHNSSGVTPPRLAGSRVKDDHRRLMQELEREAEKVTKRAA